MIATMTKSKIIICNKVIRRTKLQIALKEKIELSETISLDEIKNLEELFNLNSILLCKKTMTKIIVFFKIILILFLEYLNDQVIHLCLAHSKLNTNQVYLFFR